MEENYFLQRPCEADGETLRALTAKWRAFGGRMNPGLLRRLRDGESYASWLRFLRSREEPAKTGERVPQTFYLLKRGDGVLLGAVALRHYLNSTNLLDGGHVAYGIFPEHRGNGYGTLALRLALEKLAEMGISRVLVTCDADNLPSRKVILRNGGVLENRIAGEDGVPVDRYWIGAGAETGSPESNRTGG